MKRILTTLITVVGLALAGQLHAFMEKDASYSAIRHVESREGNTAMQVYHIPGRERVEFDAGGQKMATIMLFDRKVAWILIPQMNAYTETNIERYISHTPQGFDVVEHTKVGTETVNGYKAVKYHTTFHIKDDASGSTYTGSGYYWIVNDSIPIKMDLNGTDKKGKPYHVTIELTNLKIGPQDPSLFELPAGYHKMSVPAMSGSSSGTSAPTMSQQPAPGHAAPPPPEQPGIANEIGKAAADEAKSSTKDEVKNAVGSFVHGLFH